MEIADLTPPTLVQTISSLVATETLSLDDVYPVCYPGPSLVVSMEYFNANEAMTVLTVLNG